MEEDLELTAELERGEKAHRELAIHLSNMGANYTSRIIFLEDGSAYKVEVTRVPGVHI
jgi:hypothetical protein